MVEPVVVRDEVLAFAVAMEVALQENDHKGDSWKTCDMEYLHGKAVEEALEYIRDMNYRRVGSSKELVDLANILMFIWHRS